MVKTPKKDVNACEDFIEIITSGLVVAAALATFKQVSTKYYPAESVLQGADNMWTLPDEKRQKCLKELCGRVYDKFVCFNYNTAVLASPEGDKVYEYSVQRLHLACFYMEFADAIREGDGGTLLEIYISGSGNKNYACEAANILVQHFYTLSHCQPSYCVAV